MRQALSKIVHSITPPVIWNAYLLARGRTTPKQPTPLFEGRFAEIYAKYQPLDPHRSPESTRYDFYNVCSLANICRHLSGDFLFAGISWGVAARVTYDFVEFWKLNKTLHLVDPFDQRTSRTNPKKTQLYNSDADFVRSQYPAEARLVIHRKPIPIEPPGRLAFVYLSTGDPDTDEASIPSFYESLSPGGALVCGRYFQQTFERLGADTLWFSSGHCAIFKNKQSATAP
jgi:hypothetical protein